MKKSLLWANHKYEIFQKHTEKIELVARDLLVIRFSLIFFLAVLEQSVFVFLTIYPINYVIILIVQNMMLIALRTYMENVQTASLK